MRRLPPRFWSSLFCLFALASALVTAAVLIPNAWVVILMIFAGAGLYTVQQRMTGADGHLERLRPDPRDMNKPRRSACVWRAVQLAVVGLFFWFWLETYTGKPADPSLGSTLFMGALFAWVLTVTGVGLGELAGIVRRRLTARRGA